MHFDAWGVPRGHCQPQPPLQSQPQLHPGPSAGQQPQPPADQAVWSEALVKRLLRQQAAEEEQRRRQRRRRRRLQRQWGGPAALAGDHGDATAAPLRVRCACPGCGASLRVPPEQLGLEPVHMQRMHMPAQPSAAADDVPSVQVRQVLLGLSLGRMQGAKRA